MINYKFTQNFQDSDSPFQVPPPQIERPVNLEKSIAILLESKQQIQNLVDSHTNKIFLKPTFILTFLRETE